MSAVAVGNGAVDEEAEEEEFDEPLVFVEFPLDCVCVGCCVMVKTTEEVNVLATRPGPSVTPVVKLVERTTLAVWFALLPADWVPAAELT